MNENNIIITFVIDHTPCEWIDTLNKYSKNSKYKVLFCNKNSDNIKDTNYKYNIIIPLFTNYTIKNLCCNSVLIRPNDDVFQMFNNKKLFEAFMKENFDDIIPNTIDPLNITDSCCPFLLKICMCDGGQGVHVIPNQNSWEHVKTLLTSSEHSEEPIDYVLQEYIWSNNSMIGQYLCINGTIVHQQHYHVDIDKSKVTIIKGRLINPTYVDVNNNKINEIFKKTNYTGFACVDYTITNSTIKIFEINPRLGATVMNDYDVFFTFMKKLLDFYA